jgi:hypothetical protein
MEPRDLVKVWDAPDNSRLTPKQWSVRLPLHVAAKINALCDIYPRKTKTEIIGDLLATALDQLAEALPSRQGPFICLDPETNEEVYEEVGIKGRFFDLTQKYIKDLEEEIESK